MKKHYFFLLIVILSCFQTSGQDNPYLDSIYRASAENLDNYQYKESIEAALVLLDMAKQYDDLYYHYQAHNILGNSFSDINDTIHAKQHYQDALEAALKLENDTLLITAYNSLGNIYSEDKKTTQIGIDYYNKVIKLAKEANLESYLFAPTGNIAWTYLDNGKFVEAGPYLKSSMELLANNGSSLEISQLYTLMGRYYVGMGELEKAKPFFEETIILTQRDTLILEASIVFKEYADLLYKEKRFQEAYNALEKHEKYKAQIFEKEKLEQIRDASVKFDVSQYQEDLQIAKNEQLYKDELIEKSREKMIVLVFSAIVMLIILLALFRISLSRRKLIKELSAKNKELLKAKEEAERLSILKTQFFSTISHELRTPLYGVIGLTSILMEDKSLMKHEDDLKSLKFSADYLLALINDVLQMNKMESNLLKLEELPFNLKDLMQRIVKSFEFTRLQNKNNIHLSIDPEIANNLIGDSVRLSQILMNLVGNAMKFTERGNIWIKSELVESNDESIKINLVVKDDGMGIPESKQQIIFEEFSQLKSTNYNYQGTGLGLPIVKKLLALFNSEILLESAEGKGSSFSFKIRFLKAEVDKNLSSVVNSELKPLLSETEGDGKHILVVDDNRINQVVTQRILEQKLFTCDISDNGMDAVEKVRNNKYHLVLMDLNMPGITGLEATRRIRAFNPDIPVIALTAVEIEEVRQEIFDAGMNDFIVKPYDNSTFYQVIYRNIKAEVITH